MQQSIPQEEDTKRIAAIQADCLKKILRHHPDGRAPDLKQHPWYQTLKQGFTFQSNALTTA